MGGTRSRNPPICEVFRCSTRRSSIVTNANPDAWQSDCAPNRPAKPLQPLRRAEARLGVRVASTRAGAARYVLPPLPRRVQTSALPRKSAPLHRRDDASEGRAHPVEFDHLVRKEFDIASGIPARNWQAVLDEIAKCDVVCANCHRRRTAHRGRWTRVAVAQQQSLARPTGDDAALLRAKPT